MTTTSEKHTCDYPIHSSSSYFAFKCDKDEAQRPAREAAEWARRLWNAAPDLLAAAEGFIEVTRIFNQALLDHRTDEEIVGLMDGALDQYGAAAEAAIRLAR